MRLLKQAIIIALAILVITVSVALAARLVTLVNSAGRPLGTSGNPIYITNV